MPPDKHKAGSSRDDQPGEVPQEMLKDNKKKRPNKAQQTPGVVSEVNCIPQLFKLHDPCVDVQV